VGVAVAVATRTEPPEALVCNVDVFALLVYAGVASGLSGIGLWPTVLVHAVMGVCCVTSLLRRQP